MYESPQYVCVLSLVDLFNYAQRFHFIFRSTSIAINLFFQIKLNEVLFFNLSFQHQSLVNLFLLLLYLIINSILITFI